MAVQYLADSKYRLVARGKKTWVNAETVINIDAALYVESGVDVSIEQKRNVLLQYIPAWHFKALCAGMEDERFFGKKDLRVRPSLTLTELKKAQELCWECPVYRECITHALTKPEEYGVWGGTSRNMRLKILKAAEEGLIKIADIIEELCKAQEQIRSSRGRSSRAD